MSCLRAFWQRLRRPRRVYTVRRYSSAEYLRSREAGRNTVRVEEKAG